MTMSAAKPLVSEFIGTAFLLTAVVGSGIMGERLAGGNTAVALLANAIATGAALVALILALAPISGAHLNPLVTIAAAASRAVPWRLAGGYVAVQTVGAVLGVTVAHAMFAEPLFSFGVHDRGGVPNALGEFMATFGLLMIVTTCSRVGRTTVAFAVGAYITAAYWFTSSTSFANPAVTVARSLTTTFSGIRPADVPGFILAQVLGATAALVLMRWLVPSSARPTTPNKVVFACVHNAGRSQMAAAFFNALADPARATASSAGTQPADSIHPEVVATMGEVGINLGSETPRVLNGSTIAGAALLVTMGCGEQCPVAPGLRREDWQIRDPKGLPAAEVRAIRDEVRRRVQSLLEREGWAASKSEND